jgi:hypothetical protein
VVQIVQGFFFIDIGCVSFIQPLYHFIITFTKYRGNYIEVNVLTFVDSERYKGIATYCAPLYLLSITMLIASSFLASNSDTVAP